MDSQDIKANIQKVKNRFHQKQKVSARKLSGELSISAISVRRILKIDLGLKPYKKIIVNHHFLMIKRSNGNNFQNGFEQISEKKTLSFLFSDERFFDIDGLRYCQHEGMWAINHANPDEKGGIMQKQRESDSVVGYRCSSKCAIPLVIFDEGTVDHSCYIKSVIAVALKYGNEVFGDNCVFQEDDANPHRKII